MRVIMIVVITLALGVPEGFVMGANWQANQRASNFFKPLQTKERQYEEMRPQW